MMWMARVLAGPILWAVLFSAVYGLHGTGCSLGWNHVSAPVADWHRLAMWAVWGAGLALHVLLIRILPEGKGLRRQLILWASWTGLVSSVYTLFPVIVTSSCL